MSRNLNLLCLFGIFAILYVHQGKFCLFNKLNFENFNKIMFIIAEARSSRHLEGEGIRGGAYAKEGQFPYHISVEFNGESFCGASILSERFAVTAAHCVTDEDGSFLDVPLKVTAGTVDLESKSKSQVTVDVIKVYVPKEFMPALLKRRLEPFGDIAILEVTFF